MLRFKNWIGLSLLLILAGRLWEFYAKPVSGPIYTAAVKEGLVIELRNVRNMEGLGYCHLRQRNLVMSQRAFHLALGRGHDDESALVGHGLAFLDLQDKPAAIVMFRQVPAMDPGNAEMKNYLNRAKAEYPCILCGLRISKEEFV